MEYGVVLELAKKGAEKCLRTAAANYIAAETQSKRDYARASIKDALEALEAVEEEIEDLKS